MFTFSQTVGGLRSRILMTGDSTGDTLNQSYLNVNSTQNWDIIKVMHHGSSNNSILEGSGKYLEGIKDFFKKFQANKYVISSDTWNKSPNPDIVNQIISMSFPLLF